MRLILEINYGENPVEALDILQLSAQEIRDSIAAGFAYGPIMSNESTLVGTWYVK